MYNNIGMFITLLLIIGWGLVVLFFSCNLCNLHFFAEFYIFLQSFAELVFVSGVWEYCCRLCRMVLFVAYA